MTMTYNLYIIYGTHTFCRVYYKNIKTDNITWWKVGSAGRQCLPLFALTGEKIELSTAVSKLLVVLIQLLQVSIFYNY